MLSPTRYHDKALICQECNTVFPFTALEQQRYPTQRLLYEPERCELCRNEKKTYFTNNKHAAVGRKQRFDQALAARGTKLQ